MAEAPQGTTANGEVNETRAGVCASCGMITPPGMRFCGNCGQPVVAAAPTPPVVETPTPPPPPTPQAPATAPRPPSGAPVAAADIGFMPASIPADPVARERERDRLLTLANVQRMRGQTREARATLEGVLALAADMRPELRAPTHELLGDMLAAEGRVEEAAEAYKLAHEADPKRVSAEKKFAEMTLALAEATGKLSISEAMLRGESIKDLMASGAMGRSQGKKNAGVAMLLSILMPGFGQIYNGQVVKGCVIMGVFLLLLLLISLSSAGSAFLQQFASFLALKANSGARLPVPPWVTLAGIGVVAIWLFALVDAPIAAAKGSVVEEEREYVDKSGWEV